MPVQVLYSLATQRFSRSTLFNIVILTFMGWFVAFGLLYPSHESIHFHGLAEDTLKTLPSGLAGAVGMVGCINSTCLKELNSNMASLAQGNAGAKASDEVMVSAAAGQKLDVYVVLCGGRNVGRCSVEPALLGPGK